MRNDRQRERELLDKISEMQRRYAEELKPITDELVEIEKRKRPRDVTVEGPNGTKQTFQYVGPWPYDENGNPIVEGVE